MINLQTIPFDNEVVRYWVKMVMQALPDQNLLPSRLKWLPFETEAHRHDALHNIADKLGQHMLYRAGVYHLGEVDMLKRSVVPLLADTPPALTLKLPNVHATLLAPWTASNGRFYSGGLEIALFVGDELPKNKNLKLRFSVRRDAAGKWCSLKVQVPPLHAAMDENSALSVAEKEEIYSFLEIFVKNGNLMETGKLMLEIVKACYAANDERPKVVDELVALFTNADAK